MTVFVIEVFYTFPNKGKNMTLEQSLAEVGIKSVWHFTDLSNLDSIEKYGQCLV